MHSDFKVNEVSCKTAIGKCGFPSGGYSINPFLGCGHACVYCYARFMKRFSSGHASDDWGSFVDVKMNIASALEKQLTSKKKFDCNQVIFLGTVTDPFQFIEKKYLVSQQVLSVLLSLKIKNPISILTKSDLILRDLNQLLEFKSIEVNFTINSLNQDFIDLVEPLAPSIKARLIAVKKLVDSGIKVNAMLGPYWPNQNFTDAQKLFSAFDKAGISEIHTESFNTTGGNFSGVENALKNKFPNELEQMKSVLFNKTKFDDFYEKTKTELTELSREFKIPISVYFGQGHDKFKN